MTRFRSGNLRVGYVLFGTASTLTIGVVYRIVSVKPIRRCTEIRNGNAIISLVQSTSRAFFVLGDLFLIVQL